MSIVLASNLYFSAILSIFFIRLACQQVNNMKITQNPSKVPEIWVKSTQKPSIVPLVDFRKMWLKWAIFKLIFDLCRVWYLYQRVPIWFFTIPMSYFFSFWWFQPNFSKNVVCPPYNKAGDTPLATSTRHRVGTRPNMERYGPWSSKEC